MLIRRHPQAEVFEELTTMDFSFEGIPTVPPGRTWITWWVLLNLLHLPLL